MRRLLDSYLDSYRDLPRDVWALSSIMLVNRAGTMVLTFLALYLTRELGYPATFAGQVLAAYGAGHLVGAWLGGWLTDRIGSLPTQVASLVVSGLLFFVLGQVTAPAALVAVVFLVAVVAEALRPANGAALAALAPPKLRARAWALNRIALNLGFSIGPAVGGWLATIDYWLLFVADGVTCIAAGLLLAWLFRGRLDAPERVPDEAPDPDREPPRDASPWRDRVFLGVPAVNVLMALCFLQGWSTYPLDLAERFGFDEVRFGLLLMVNALMILVLEMPITRAVESFDPLKVLGIGAFLVGASFALLVGGPLPVTGGAATVAIATIVVFTVGEMLALPIAGGWVSNRAGARRRGAYMGLFVMSWGVAWVLAPAVGTWTLETLGAPALWLGSLVVGVVALAVSWALAART